MTGTSGSSWATIRSRSRCPASRRRGRSGLPSKGVFITEASDATTPEQYIARCAGQKTIAQRVKDLPEQSYASGFPGPAAPARRGVEPGVQELPAAVLARPQRRHHAREHHGPATSRGRHGALCQRRRPWGRARPVLLRAGAVDHAGAGYRRRAGPGLEPACPQGRHRDRPDEPGRTAGRPG